MCEYNVSNEIVVVLKLLIFNIKTNELQISKMKKKIKQIFL